MAALLPALPFAETATANAASLRLAGALHVRLWLAAAAMATLLAAIAVAALLLPPAAALAFILGLVLAGLTLCLGCAAWLLLRVARPMARALAAARRLRSGDLTGTIDSQGAGELAPLLAALREVQERLFTVVSQVRTGTTSVAGTSSQIQRDNDALDLRTGTQVDSLQSTAASMEQLTAAVRHNAENAQQAEALVVEASERATQGGALMGEVVATMGAIREGSRRIVDIIGVIDSIAFQTNILALNAAVEAARAGEQGRGFAVVASEVRNLAQRCAAAAKEVKELIAASADGIDAGGRQVDAAGQAMTEIVAAVRQVAERIGQISVGSREQSDGIESVNQAVARIEHTTQANASLVKMAARTSLTLNAQGVALLQSVALFDLGEREHGNAEEAVALVGQAAAFAQSHGVQALVEDVNKLAAGRFVERDLYLMVIRAADDVFIAHGNNPRTLGLGRQSKDADGKSFVQEMVRVAQGKQQGGWVDYKWAHPVTNEVLTKSSFVRQVGDVVLACGIYKRQV